MAKISNTTLLVGAGVLVVGFMAYQAVKSIPNIPDTPPLGTVPTWCAMLPFGILFPQ